MKNFEKIYEENIQHNSFLDKDSIMKSMVESYNMGVSNILEWLSKNDYLTDTKEQLLKEYQQNKIIDNNVR